MARCSGASPASSLAGSIISPAPRPSPPMPMCWPLIAPAGGRGPTRAWLARRSSSRFASCWPRQHRRDQAGAPPARRADLAEGGSAADRRDRRHRPLVPAASARPAARTQRSSRRAPCSSSMRSSASRMAWSRRARPSGPRATCRAPCLMTIGTTTLLYFLVQLAFIAALPGGGTDDKAPLIDLGSWLAGPVGALILTLAAIASLGGNLHGIMTSTPQGDLRPRRSRRLAPLVCRGPSALRHPGQLDRFSSPS